LEDANKVTFGNIPRISDKIEILPFDNGGFLVHHKVLGHRLNINNFTYQLLNYIDGVRNIKEIAAAFNKDNTKSVNEDTIFDILYSKLGKYHVIENEEHEVIKREKPSYLKLSFTLLKKEWVTHIIPAFSFLFNKSVFYTLFTLSFLFMIYMVISNHQTMVSGLKDITVLNGSLYLLFFGLVTLFHEFGHAAACRKFGAKHGDIGFGFYLLSSVMYADVSDVWKLKKSERIIVNLGGIYLQLLIATCISIYYLFTNNNHLIIPAYVIGGLSVVYNLNPFFRTDGYWILSDILGIANLRSNSNRTMRQFVKKIIGKGEFEFSLKNILLTAYALASLIFIAAFLFVILVKNPDSLINYPLNVFEYISSVSEQRHLNIPELQQLMLPTLFIFLLSKFSIRLFKAKFQPLSREMKRDVLSIVVKIMLSSVFLLSAVGKTLDFNDFTRKVDAFGLSSIDFIPYVILLIEYVLAVGFILYIYTKITAKIALAFLLFMTSAYSIGHFYLNIETCGCFGSFEILNPANYSVFIVKNLALIVLCTYLVFSSGAFTSKIKKTVITAVAVISICFFIHKMEARFIRNFADNNKGKAISELSLDKTYQIDRYQYWFVFSPTCPHCIAAIPKINEYTRHTDIALIGITASKDQGAIDKLNIEFPVQKIDKDDVLKLTKTIPKIFEIEHDTIQQVYRLDDFLEVNKSNESLPQ